MYLHPREETKDGQKVWKRQGRDGLDGIEIARNKEFIVLKTAGYSFNASGVRGMRDDCYVAAAIDVYRIIQALKDGILKVEHAIDFPAATPKAPVIRSGLV